MNRTVNEMGTMRHMLSTASALWLGLAGVVCATGTALAQEAFHQQPVLVELYTSQGCSSCPPADEYMVQLAKEPGVIALSLHVDYWDYIGWKDTFADPKFTSRQKSYAKSVGSRMIYTPQMIVHGQDHVQGNDPAAVAAAIAKHQALSSPVRLQVERRAGEVHIRVEAEPALTNAARIQLIRYEPEAEVLIERGENAGRLVTYTNIVTGWDQIADWPGELPLETAAVVDNADPVVVVVQSIGPGEVLAAAQID